MKMVAFLDRPDREDDLTDIVQVVEGYLGRIDDRRWKLSIDFDNMSAFALGMDVGSLTNKKEREVVTNVRREGAGRRGPPSDSRPADSKWTLALARTPGGEFDRLAAFEKGMLETLSSP
jgi:hypothetical protein